MSIRTTPPRLAAATVAAAAVALLVGCSSGQDAPVAGETSEGVAPADGVTMAEVEANSDADSCWTVIDGTVYDLTEWIGQHPGGAERIEGLCGTDGTDAFTGQHGGDTGPEARLAEFEVGQLAE